jgi:hypothetical protein
MSNNIDIKNFGECIEAFVCANTPSYLYTHLRGLVEVENLAEASSASELYEMGRHALEEEKTSDGELSFYIVLIALSFKPYSEMSSYLKDLKTDKYKWANAIIVLVKSKYGLVTEDTIDIKHEPSITGVQGDLQDIEQVAEYVANANIQPVISSPEHGFADSTTSDISIDLEQRGDEKDD